MSSCNEKLDFPRNSSGVKKQKISLVTSAKEVTSQKTFQHLLPLKTLKLAPIHSGELFSFVIKVAALETVRRFSKVRCPSLWKVVQAFQIFCYPPFKWLQRWGPLRIIVRGAQSIAKPVLLLSIATTFLGNSENCRGATARVDDSQTQSDSVYGNSTFDIQSEESSKDITPESFKKDIPEGWQLQICGELEKQGISLPERFNEDELNRFYAAANGDLACLLSSLKKSIRWRESYNILSSQELEVWSHLVFWHGFDVMLRPCLVIRLGLACSTLAPDERPRFAQAIVSQIDHGVLNLIDENDSKITVLMDCEGLSPFKFPMNMMRSCSVLVQDHYPNRLGTLFILRLPPVVRVLTQTFIQVLKPTTRKKLRIVGEKNRKLLSDFLESVPAFLGGDCSCPRCRMLSASRSSSTEEFCRGEPSGNATSDDALAASSDFQATELPFSGSCEHLLRAAVVLILMLWVLIAFFAVTSEPDSVSFPL